MLAKRILHLKVLKFVKTVIAIRSRQLASKSRSSTEGLLLIGIFERRG